MTAGTSVAGLQNDITFDAARAAIGRKPNGKPDCTVNPAIHKGLTGFAFLPHGCSGTACKSIRALVVAADNVDPIPEGSKLYSCKVKIPAGTPPGTYALTLSTVVLSSPKGKKIAGATGVNGTITVH